MSQQPTLPPGPSAPVSWRGLLRDDAPTRALLLGGAAGSAAVTTVVALAVALGRGPDAAWSAVLGGLIVIAFFTGGVLSVAALLRLPALLALPGALTIFLVQAVLLLGVAMVLVQSQVDAPGLTIAALASVLAWQVLGTWRWSQARQLRYQPRTTTQEFPSDGHATRRTDGGRRQPEDAV